MGYVYEGLNVISKYNIIQLSVFVYVYVSEIFIIFSLSLALILSRILSASFSPHTCLQRHSLRSFRIHAFLIGFCFFFVQFIYKENPSTLRVRMEIFSRKSTTLDVFGYNQTHSPHTPHAQITYVHIHTHTYRLSGIGNPILVSFSRRA